MFTGKRTNRNQLAVLNAAINQCDVCALHAGKGLGYGNPKAAVLLLGQNTGLKIQGSNPEKVPFGLHDSVPSGVGKSADVLREILWDCAIHSGDYYVTNIMKCQVKKPEPYMIENCRPWLHDELAGLPELRLIVAIGRLAGDVVGARIGMLSFWRPDIREVRKYFVTQVSHPAFLLYPGGISCDDYRTQWQFVSGIISRLYHEPTTKMLGR